MAAISAGSVACALLVRHHNEHLAFWLLPLIAALALFLCPTSSGTPQIVLIGATGLAVGVTLPMLVSFGQQLLRHGQRVASGLMMGVTWAFASPIAAGTIEFFEHLECPAKAAGAEDAVKLAFPATRRENVAMTILFLHGWQSVPGGVKPTYLRDHGHEVVNPALPHEDFAEAVRIAQAEFDKHQPQVIVGSSRGGAIAMNMKSGDARLVLLCPAWKKYGTATTAKPSSVILHSRTDDVVPFADSEELAKKTGATLIEVGNDHRLADPEPLVAMLRACEGQGKVHQLEWDKHHERVEYGVVRVAHLLRPDRHFQGTPGVCRAPQVGDTGTLVYAYDLTSFAVECVSTDGMTVWLADFFAEELEFLVHECRPR